VGSGGAGRDGEGAVGTTVAGVVGVIGGGTTGVGEGGVAVSSVAGAGVVGDAFFSFSLWRWKRERMSQARRSSWAGAGDSPVATESSSARNSSATTEGARKRRARRRETRRRRVDGVAMVLGGGGLSTEVDGVCRGWAAVSLGLTKK